MKNSKAFKDLAPQRQFSLNSGLSTPKLKNYSDYLSKKPIFLNNQQIINFLSLGYISLTPTLPNEFHDRIFSKIDDLIGNGKDEENPGNNILPLIPEFQLLFKDPIIHGALFSLLGPNYMLHPHRYIHDNPPKSGGQAWHHDTYWGYLKKVRNWNKIQETVSNSMIYLGMVFLSKFTM